MARERHKLLMAHGDASHGANRDGCVGSSSSTAWAEPEKDQVYVAEEADFMPELPDGTPEDENGVPGPGLHRPRSGLLGKEGRPTHFTGPRSEHVPAWRYPLRAQISAVTDEVQSLEDDLVEWSTRARNHIGQEHGAGAQYVCRRLDATLECRRAWLRWLRNEIPVDPATGVEMDEY
jgi:hypothetical protein